ncbi:MAG: hypothetical protein PUP91_04135 [Rhizonema sp. PD37]|nr:hypothetical protein [Rhizonema sp. PD37]
MVVSFLVEKELKPLPGLHYTFIQQALVRAYSRKYVEKKTKFGVTLDNWVAEEIAKIKQSNHLNNH